MFDRNKEKAFSLIELLVVLAIISILSTAIFSVFRKIVGDFNTEYQKLTSQIEFSSGIELLRADISHAGYGLANDLGLLPVETNATKDILTIKGTIDITNKKTRGWILVDCRNGKFNVQLDSREIKLNTQNFVFLDINKNFVANGLYGTCPSNAILVGFPLDVNYGNCNGQNCYQIVYKLSKTQNLNSCSQNTKNLLRVVGNGNGEPIISCVKTFNVNVDTFNKVVNITLQVQEGDKKENRWQTIKLSVKPMNW